MDGQDRQDGVAVSAWTGGHAWAWIAACAAMTGGGDSRWRGHGGFCKGILWGNGDFAEASEGR